MHRNRKIEQLVESVETWDYPVLLAWSKETMRLILNQLTDEDIDIEYEILKEEIM